MRTEISGSLGSHLDRPIPLLSTHLRSLDISIQLKSQPKLGSSTSTATTKTVIANAATKGKLKIRTKMGPRIVTDRHLSLPATSTSGSRSRSVSDRSDRSDDSELLDSVSQQSGETGSKASRKRASRPKVRTGCILCKQRHVKCDEGKPGCARCENLGLKCLGYAQPKSTKKVSRTERPLLPRPLLASLAPQAARTSLQPADIQLPLLVSPGFGFEVGDDDGWYFTLFRDQVVYDLTPCYRSNFWTRSSIRDSMTMRSIRHSILSIGAYARGLMDLKSEFPWLAYGDRPWWPTGIINKHHQAALNHHAKALAFLREDIRANGVDSRTTMAATLLFIVFENMQGNYHASGVLVRNGIKVLNNMGRGESRNFLWQTYCESFDPPNEIDEMAHMFSRHSITSVLTPFPHGKSAYHMLLNSDDDLEDDSSVLVDNDENLTIEYTTRSTTPRTLDHARVIWDTTLPALGRYYAKALWRNLNPEYQTEGELASQQVRYLAKLRDFGRGLAALVSAEQDEIKLRGLNFLAIHHLVATIYVSCCLDRTETLYDDFTPEFEATIVKIREYLARSSAANKTGFSNEVGILPLVAFVTAKCRVPGIRLEALSIMRNTEAREGPWDGTSLSTAMVNLMELEGQKEGGDDGPFTPPSESRYVWTNMFWDFERRQMTMEYTRVWSNGMGDPVKVVRMASF